MIAGAVSIQLLADTADLVRQMNKADSIVDSTMQGMSKMAGITKAAFAGLATLGIGAAAGAVGGFIKSSLDATASLSDMAKQTGASESALSEFRRIGATTETTLEDITGAMGKLSKNMVTGTEESKGAGIAIKALGLDFNKLKAMAPEEQMLEIAKAMDGFANGADKSAAAQALFGKEGAKLLPYLADLAASADDVTAKLTDQEKALKATEAAMADAFGDNMTMAQKQVEGMGKTIVTGMTPALFEVSQAFLDVISKPSGLTSSIQDMARDGTIAEWTRTAVTLMTYVMDGFSGVGVVVKSTGLFIGAFFAQLFDKLGTAGEMISKFAQGDWAGAMESMRAGTERQTAMQAALRADLDATWGTQTFGAQLRERMAELKGVGVEAEATKPKLDVSAALAANEAARKRETEATKLAEKATADALKEQKKQEEQYAKLTGGIDTKILSMQRELETGAKLSDSDKLALQLQADLESGTIKLTGEQIKAVQAKIELLKQTEALTEAQKRERAEADQAEKEYVALIERLQKGTEATQSQIDKQRESNDTLLLNREELQALAIQKDLDTAATYEQRAAYLEQEKIGSELASAFRDQADKLRELAGLKQQGVHVQAAKEAQDAWKRTTESIGSGLSSALIDAVTQGKDIWVAFRDFMVRTIIDGVLQKALASTITAALQGNSISSALSGVGAALGFGGAGAGAAGGAAAGAAGAAGAGAGMAGSAAAFDAALASSGAGSAGASAVGSAALQGAGVVAAAVLAYNYLKGPASPWETVGYGVNAASFGDVPWLQSRNRDTGATMYIARENPAFQGANVTDLLAAIENAGRQSYFAYMAYADSPGLATGTNYVPHDMVATIHQGEAVVPRKYNPAAGGAYDGGASAVEVADELRTLRLLTAQTVSNTGKMARLLDRVIPDGDAIATRAATA